MERKSDPKQILSSIFIQRCCLFLISDCENIEPIEQYSDYLNTFTHRISFSVDSEKQADVISLLSENKMKVIDRKIL